MGLGIHYLKRRYQHYLASDFDGFSITVCISIFAEHLAISMQLRESPNQSFVSALAICLINLHTSSNKF